LAGQGTKRRVLLIDNEPDITTTLQVGLTEGGDFDVDAFTDPLLAFKYFRPNFYDLALIDIVMPELDGFELYERLKKIDPDIKVCFLTASEMYHEEFREVKHRGFNEDLFLQKPISAGVLVREINKKINSTQPAIQGSNTDSIR
jgi:DNA-binding response OmpR family regulator